LVAGRAMAVPFEFVHADVGLLRAATGGRVESLYACNLNTKFETWQQIRRMGASREETIAIA
jgi:hypothetical protein